MFLLTFEQLTKLVIYFQLKWPELYLIEEAHTYRSLIVHWVCQCHHVVYRYIQQYKQCDLMCVGGGQKSGYLRRR